MSYGGPSTRWPWALDEETSRPFFQRTLERGINFFDTANVYSFGRSEEIIIGATKPHHLDDAIAALSLQLTPDEVKHMEEAYFPHMVIGYS
jgi:aryl-alcohol dehydrogenase-like predicted oxidoreductase